MNRLEKKQYNGFLFTFSNRVGGVYAHPSHTTVRADPHTAVQCSYSGITPYLQFLRNTVVPRIYPLCTGWQFPFSNRIYATFIVYTLSLATSFGLYFHIPCYPHRSQTFAYVLCLISVLNTKSGLSFPMI